MEKIQEGVPLDDRLDRSTAKHRSTRPASTWTHFAGTQSLPGGIIDKGIDKGYPKWISGEVCRYAKTKDFLQILPKCFTFPH